MKTSFNRISVMWSSQLSDLDEEQFSDLDEKQYTDLDELDLNAELAEHLPGPVPVQEIVCSRVCGRLNSTRNNQQITEDYEATSSRTTVGCKDPFVNP